MSEEKPISGGWWSKLKKAVKEGIFVPSLKKINEYSSILTTSKSKTNVDTELEYSDPVENNVKTEVQIKLKNIPWNNTSEVVALQAGNGITITDDGTGIPTINANSIPVKKY